MCTRTNEIHQLSMDGEVLQTYKGEANGGADVGNFVSCALSIRSKWLYAVTDKGYILSFATATGSLESSMQICNGYAFGLSHHPHRNLIATYGNDGYVRLWKA